MFKLFFLKNVEKVHEIFQKHLTVKSFTIKEDVSLMNETQQIVIQCRSVRFKSSFYLTESLL